MDLEIKKQMEDLQSKLYQMPADEFFGIIQNFPDINATYPAEDTYNGGRSLLHFAATAHNAQAIRFLIGKELDPNLEDINGVTPLICLAGRGATVQNFKLYQPEPVYEATMALLDAGASALKKNKYDDYPFQIAAKTGNHAFLKALKEKGVRIMRLDDEGNNALHLALSGPVERYNWTNTALHKMVFVPDPATDSFPFFTNTPGLYEEYLEFINFTVEVLMEMGIDPEQANNAGMTPLEMAFRCEAKKARAIMKGLDNAATDEAVAATGGLTLQQAVFQRDREAVEAILEAGYQDIDGLEELVPHPDPKYDWEDMPPYGDGTALGQSCLLFYPEMIELLLQKGANPNVKDSNGRTALCWFFMHNRRLHPDYFINDTPGRIINMMVKAGLNINDSVLDSGFTLLNFACASWFGDVYPGTHERGDAFPGNRLLSYDNYLVKDTFRMLVIKALLKNNPDVNIPNKDGVTPLMFACGSGQMPLASEISMLLLEKGADLTAKDNSGNTALIYAACNEDPAVGYDIAQNLFDFGDPETSAVNSYGKKALDYAVERGNEALVKLLVSTK